jgi:predicted RND superfamily exporter protein
MNLPGPPVAVRSFLRILSLRHWIVGAFLLATAAGVFGALRVADDSAIESLIVASDPLARATQAFQRLFPEGTQALLMLEAADPLSPAALAAADRLEHALAAIPGVETHTLITVFRRATSAGPIDAANALALRRFATGTSLFRRAGLLGDQFLGVALELHVRGSADRDRALAAIDAVLLPYTAAGSPFTAVRRIGSPWLDAWLERETGVATARFMPLYGFFLMALVVALYRSWRTLAAVILTLGAVVAISVGLAALIGFRHTVVSALVPLTVLITTTATLVYIHSRYIEEPDSGGRFEPNARALANKFVPCTASMFATAVGFAALAISDIRPIREMGLWTAAGLVVAWIGSFTLFPALQVLLATPRQGERRAAGRSFPRFVDFLVPFSARYRWPLVAGALLIMLCGAVALFGIRGRIAPLPLETDALTYVDPHVSVAADTRRFGEVAGLAVIELWLETPPGEALAPEFLQALERLTERLERDPRITAVDGPTSVLRWARYISTGSDRLPDDPSAWPKLAADLEQVLLTEPAARSFVDVASLGNARLSIRGRDSAFGGTGAMREYVEQIFHEAARSEPGFRGIVGRTVGEGVLSEHTTQQLVPTLVESFALTAGVIFCAFLLVFRSPSARLMAMIPSVFAILGAFLVMRLVSIPLNIATILIGSTVLGATENDQVHFFYHFQEGRSAGSTVSALRHALNTAGRPIMFATLINAAGFLALSFSDLPPMRQFGIVSATAFFLALLADFTALPAALWILDRPGARAHAAARSSHP